MFSRFLHSQFDPVYNFESVTQEFYSENRSFKYTQLTGAFYRLGKGLRKRENEEKSRSVFHDAD